jgi:hypothetical protein
MNSAPQVSIGKPSPKPIEFARVKNEPPSRLILTVDGLPKEGKTNFALTAPAPICIHNFDFGLSGVVEKFAEKELYQFVYQIPLTARLPGSGFASLVDPAARVWEEYVLQFRESLLQMRTVIVDTGSEAWNLCRLARLGKLTQVLPVQYTAVNAEFRQLTQLALCQSKCNVIFTHKLKAEYKNDQKTGAFERAGFGEIEYDVETVLKASRDYGKTGLEQFSIEVQSCRANLEASGKRFVGADCTFQKVAAAVYPGTTEESWK